MLFRHFARTAAVTFFAAALIFAPVLAQDLPTGSRLTPTAHLEQSDDAVTPGTAVQYDASSSLNASGTTGGLEYRLAPLGATFTEWQTSPTFSFTYDDTDMGTFLVRLQVRDENGRLDETSSAITIMNNELRRQPDVFLFANPEKVGVDDDIVFTARPMSYATTPRELLEIRIDVDGDEVWDIPWTTGREFVHAYSLTGTYTPTIEVYDPGVNLYTTVVGVFVEDPKRPGSRDEGEVGRISVVEGTTPLAGLYVYPSITTLGSTVTLDAGPSKRAKQYRFDANGDGIWDSPWQTEPAFSYRYTQDGDFTARVQVKSSAGGTDVTQRRVSIVAPSAIGPNASLSVTNRTNSALKNMGVQWDAMRFDATATRDDNSSFSSLSARFDFDGDSAWDTPYGPLTAEHRYAAAGDYTAKVQVRDEQGTTDTTSVFVRIIENTAPVASLSVPESARIHTRVRLSAADSRDAQSGTSGLTYRFDANGDGKWDTQWQPASSTTFIYSTPGTYTVKAAVRDTLQKEGVATTAITIADIVPPRATLSASPTVGTYETVFTFDATLGLTPAEKEQFQFRWHFNSVGASQARFDTGWSKRGVITRRFTKPGEFIVHVQTKNDAGQLADAFHAITISHLSPLFSSLAQRGIHLPDQPGYSLSRGEFAALLVKAKGIRQVSPVALADMPATHPHSASLATAFTHGWLSVLPGAAAQPDSPISRIDAITASVKALHPVVAIEGRLTQKDVQKVHRRYVSVVSDLPAFAGTKLYPNRPLTAASAAELFNALISTPTAAADISALAASFLSRFR